MTNKNHQDEFDHLRSGATEKMEDAPTLGSAQKPGKEIKVRRSPWILRSLILVLAVLVIVELFVFNQHRKEAQRIIVQNPPAVKSSPVPEISAPLPIPPIEAASADDFLEEPTPIPLPPELEGIELSPVDE
ncbi:MAG: hypothetical protein HN855_08715 [Anaerolineae bacterium]|jgi:hypothetical protein|nr:hypothetical protein [Anaerolineae bacterium]MBT7071700.1 hypothetical protein [Anaerolineae bacterium]MBT7325226.1 hypothetical protein [Anaerolineae bacterium]